MRAFLFLLITLAVAGSASLAQAEPPQTVNPRSASGDTVVIRGPSVITHHFHVIGKPLSLAAVGSFQMRVVDEGRVDIDFTGEVDCLKLVGKRAYMSGTIVASNNEDSVGRRFLTAVADNPPDGPGDWVGAVFEGPPGGCAGDIPTYVWPEFEITSGNVTVSSRGPSR